MLRRVRAQTNIYDGAFLRKVELFCEKVTVFSWLIFWHKSTIIDVLGGSKYVSRNLLVAAFTLGDHSFST